MKSLLKTPNLKSYVLYLNILQNEKNTIHRPRWNNDFRAS